MQMPRVIIKDTLLAKWKKSNTCLYLPESSKSGFAATEIKGIITEMPIVSTKEEPIVITVSMIK
jgi:hypothetical protein